MPQKAFQQFLETEGLTNHPLLLMVSGGVDSMTLLDVAAKNHPSKLLHVLHFNHQSREGNKDDEQLVQQACDILNIPCTIHCIDKAKDPQNQESYWRSERRKASIDLAKRLDNARVLTAHHATDLVETMLFRLVKGCGPSGLSPFDTSMKPFWQISRLEIVKYGEENNLNWNEDPSNYETTYHRNLIRHQVIPHLRKITPNLEKVFVNESVIFGEIDQYLQEAVPQSPSYPITEFLSLPKALQRNILRSLCPKTPSFDEMEDFFRWIENEPQGGSQKDLGGMNFKVENQQLCW